MVARLTVAERKGFAAYARELDRAMGHGRYVTPREPALGTVAQRLDIVIRRHPKR